MVEATRFGTLLWLIISYEQVVGKPNLMSVWHKISLSFIVKTLHIVVYEP
jgi:hypothetical protein